MTVSTRRTASVASAAGFRSSRLRAHDSPQYNASPRSLACPDVLNGDVLLLHNDDDIVPGGDGELDAAPTLRLDDDAPTLRFGDDDDVGVHVGAKRKSKSQLNAEDNDTNTNTHALMMNQKASNALFSGNLQDGDLANAATQNNTPVMGTPPRTNQNKTRVAPETPPREHKRPRRSINNALSLAKRMQQQQQQETAVKQEHVTENKQKQLTSNSDSDSETKLRLLALPPEVICLVLSHLGATDLVKASLACHALYDPLPAMPPPSAYTPTTSTAGAGASGSSAAAAATSSNHHHHHHHNHDHGSHFYGEHSKNSKEASCGGGLHDSRNTMQTLPSLTDTAACVNVQRVASDLRATVNGNRTETLRELSPANLMRRAMLCAQADARPLMQQMQHAATTNTATAAITMTATAAATTTTTANAQTQTHNTRARGQQQLQQQQQQQHQNGVVFDGVNNNNNSNNNVAVTTNNNNDNNIPTSPAAEMGGPSSGPPPMQLSAQMPPLVAPWKRLMRWHCELGRPALIAKAPLCNELWFNEEARFQQDWPVRMVEHGGGGGNGAMNPPGAPPSTQPPPPPSPTLPHHEHNQDQQRWKRA